MDIAKHPLLKQCYELCLAIEACGASPELTDAVTKAGSLMHDVERLIDTTVNAPPVHSSAMADVFAERRRQIVVEGWTPTHDDEHEDGTLAQAAACYALNAQRMSISCGDSTIWPFDKKWWKPKDRRRDLVRAAALLIAEIDRLDRIGDAPIQ